MKAEQLGETTYKITLDRLEAQKVPTDGRPQDMRRFICTMIERLDTEQGVSIPQGKLLVEAFLRSDGSYVFFVSTLECLSHEVPQPHLYACEVTGIEQLRSLCGALAAAAAECSVYCGSSPDRYRLILSDPDETTIRICTEYSDTCEISPLFAAQTREYLTEIAAIHSAAFLYELLS